MRQQGMRLLLVGLLAASAALVIAAAPAAGSARPAVAVPANDCTKDCGSGGKKKGGGESPATPAAPETPAAPAKPAAPPSDAVGEGKGGASTLSESDLTAARAYLRESVLRMALFCGAAIAERLAGEEPVVVYYADMRVNPSFERTMASLCQEEIIMVRLIVGLLNPALQKGPPGIVFHDRTAEAAGPEYLEVAFPAQSRVAPATVQCSKRLSARACLRLNAAIARYESALAATTAATEGLATSLERFAEAGQAGSAAGQRLQAGAAKAYAGELAAAYAEEQVAGRAFANSLRQTRTEVAVRDARMGQGLVKKLTAPNGIPASIVSEVVASGAVRSAAELSQELRSVLTGLPAKFTLSGRLGVPLTTQGLTDLQKSVTVYEVAAIVRALVAQGLVTAAAGDVLLNDLGLALAATTPDAHAAALAQLGKDVAGVTGPAGALLGVGAGSLG
jgi:hypothetical protein